MKWFEDASQSRLTVLLIGLIVVFALTACQSSLPPLTSPGGESAATATLEVATTEPTATPEEVASTPTGQPEPTLSWSAADVERISVEDTKKRFDAGDALIVDVRSGSQYEAWHIPGATHIPLSEIEDRLDELPREAEIILYCT